MHGEAVRIAHTVLLGDTELMELSVDLVPSVPSHSPWKSPEVIPFPEHIMSTGSPHESPDLRVISREDTLADKVSGMYTKGVRTLDTKCVTCVSNGGGLFSCKNGDLPYRPQDLVDVLVLALNSSWDGPATHAMLRAEFARRIAENIPLQVPHRFEVPNPNWEQQFTKYAATTPGIPYMTLREATPLAEAFLNPLLAHDPPNADWNPGTRKWVERIPEPAGEHVAGPAPAKHAAQPSSDPHPAGAADGPPEAAHPHARDAEAAGEAREHAPEEPPKASQIEATGDTTPSKVFAEQHMIDRWDALSAGPHDPRSLGARIEELKARTDQTTPQKIAHIHQDLMPAHAYELSPVPSVDNKHLRIYAHQSGEVYIHGSALMVDPHTTIEIAYQPERAITTYQREAYETHISHLDPVPEGMTADEANAVAMRRATRGQPIHGVEPAVLAGDLVDLHAQPLGDALTIRRRLIDEYGIEPHRVRLAHADETQGLRYGETRWFRAHLFALDQIRESPLDTRQAMVDALRGSGETARSRDARVRAVAERVYVGNERRWPRSAGSGPEKYALLWVRDTRERSVGGPHLDTRPEILRQTIETVRESHPDRHILLVGDDLFARRPELREAWEREGVLDGVDSSTLVTFWDAARNDGVRLNHAEQALLFHRLNAQRDVVQIGMESGVLEMPAILGMPTVYFEAREHDGNKGNRWQLYWQGWRYGHTEPLRDARGNSYFDTSARAVTEFRGTGDPLPPPLHTMRRVQYGPDLPDPANRRGRPVAVYDPAKVGVTADRINRLVDSGELAEWPRRLGRSAPLKAEEWHSWDEADWARSRFYADQLHRWLRTEAGTPEEAGRKWEATRLALRGVVDPRTTSDPIYDVASIVHPYTMLRSGHELSPAEAARIESAYAAPPDRRGEAVVEVLKDLLDSPDFRRQAVDDIRLFRLDQAEIHELRAAIDAVTGTPVADPVAPFDLKHAVRLDTPVGDGVAEAPGGPARVSPPVAGPLGPV